MKTNRKKNQTLRRKRAPRDYAYAGRAYFKPTNKYNGDGTINKEWERIQTFKSLMVKKP